MTKIDVDLEVEKPQDDELDLYAKLCRVLLQLEEENAVIKSYQCYDDSAFGKASAYCKKWGVK